MITEAEERELSKKIKERFINEKGLSVFIEVDDLVFANPTIHFPQNDSQFNKLVYTLQARETPYAVFNYSYAEPTFTYQGKTFYQIEMISTGEIIFGGKQRKKVPIDMGKVKKELELLAKMLRDPKAS